MVAQLVSNVAACVTPDILSCSINLEFKFYLHTNDIHQDSYGEQRFQVKNYFLCWSNVQLCLTHRIPKSRCLRPEISPCNLNKDHLRF